MAPRRKQIRKLLLKPYRQTLLRKHSDLGLCCSDRQFARQEHIPIATLRGWLKQKHEYLESVKRGSNTTLDGHGQLESVSSFGADLVKFMDSVRDIEKFLTTAHVVTWLKTHQQPWLDAYLDSKPDQVRAYKCLLGWCQAFAHGHGFSQRVPCVPKKTQAELRATRVEYAKSFWPKYTAYDPACLHGAHELGLASHRKLPPFVIVHGQPGGLVEQTELPTYPRGAIYAVQENAWVDERVWDIYLRELLRYEIEAPSVVVVDNQRLASEVPY
ncbi:hypothetical protein H257_14498 [Aphanomyces astaci]|uniref:DDE-1 domain-containing protein n=1 Tax=Aphanomyces astaci TaxID=112090 RepID=W4FSS3_APHAT|nr:hypothetical protein H257_14498 [Aphanomyces astaci]ETV69899.1 hypothetical protein H257_14498 [Aphanomyces astaci]|eukprot:XP_009840637.1 hypothetical protein H257_14498 [Aphanomyces astaci]